MNTCTGVRLIGQSMLDAKNASSSAESTTTDTPSKSRSTYLHGDGQAEGEAGVDVVGAGEEQGGAQIEADTRHERHLHLQTHLVTNNLQEY